jgi:hypothetical protein
MRILRTNDANPKTLKAKTLNPENSKSKSLRIASVFIILYPLVISISYCLDVLFECGPSRGLEGTSRR